MKEDITQSELLTKFTNEFIRETYNSDIAGKYDNNYEFNRWFSGNQSRAEYTMTYLALTHHIQNIHFKQLLEIGPGPGTWTRLAYRRNPNAAFDLVDIAHGMKHQFMLEMREKKNINYIVSDIFEYPCSVQYDFIMSIRAFEYFEDKLEFIKKLHELLADGGKGIIVTKNRNYGFGPKKSVPLHHSGQIAPQQLTNALIQHGFRNIEVYPVVIRLPLSGLPLGIIRTRIAEKVFNRVFTKPLSGRLVPFVESYLVSFGK